MPKILLQTFKFQRRSFIFWTIGIILLVALYISVYPSIRDSSKALTDYLDKLPEAFKSIVGEASTYITPSGYINTEMFSMMLPLIILIYSIGFGSGAISGEEENGTLEIALANPIRRSRILLEKFGALILSVGFLCIIIVLVILIGTKIADMSIPIDKVAAATFSLFLLGVNAGTIALFFGALTGNRGVSIGITAAITVLSFFINILAPAVSGLDKIKEVSLFYHYMGHTPLLNGIYWPSALLFIWVTIILVSFSLVAFSRRDLNV
ncbi:MAG TPA: ABC transporter permease subunit [Candidatus Saccharimonadales bacterium]|nr:ABC transporter permease subunit [Candidatus Saccharimonadales bacterium]